MSEPLPTPDPEPTRADAARAEVVAFVRAWQSRFAMYRSAAGRLLSRISHARRVGAIALGALLLAGAVSLWAAAVAMALVIGMDWLLDRRADRVVVTGSHKRPDRPTTSISSVPGLQAVVDGLADGAIVLAVDTTVVHFNVAAADLLPRLRAGNPMAQVSRAPELLTAIDSVLGGGDAITVIMHERVPVERRMSVRVARLGSEADSASRSILLTFRELTEQDRLASMRADFVANASHELRTPLAALRGFVDTLQGAAKDDAEARGRFLAIMSEQAERMTRLIDDLLSLSRIEMHEHVPPRGKVDLIESARSVAHALEPIAVRSGVTVTVVQTGEIGLVRGDRDELVQVLQNLMQNAIKYGRQGGRVVVRISGGANGVQRFVRVAVEDDGPGIAAQHLPRLTERFYRVSATTSREKGGTGLGLAIVKHILARHGSELRITSAVGQGSTFAFSIDQPN